MIMLNPTGRRLAIPAACTIGWPHSGGGPHTDPSRNPVFERSPRFQRPEETVYRMRALGRGGAARASGVRSETEDGTDTPRRKYGRMIKPLPVTKPEKCRFCKAGKPCPIHKKETTASPR